MSRLARIVQAAFGAKSSAVTSLDLFREIMGSRASRSGATVNWQTALEVTTVLACVRVLANGVAQVPFKVYRTKAGGRDVATGHPLYQTLGQRPNPWQTSFEFRETLVFHIALTGNAYVFVNRVGAERRVHELLPIEPGRVTVERRPDQSLTYKVRADSGQTQDFGADAIWHLRGPSWNSWLGQDATRLAREAIGLASSLETGQADFQKNGAKTSGLFSVDAALSPEKYAQLRKYFDDQLAKAGAYSPLILDQGAEYTPFTMSGVDQQLLETRKHQIEEICRAFGVMPIMVGHADKTATYASAEQMFLAHVVHTLDPWYARLEQSADANLLSPADRAAGYYTKFTPNGLMRGAAKDRSEFYAKALGSGGSAAWMTPNEVRGLEEMDRIDGGDTLAQPMQAPPAPAQQE